MNKSLNGELKYGNADMTKKEVDSRMKLKGIHIEAFVDHRTLRM